MSQTSTEPRQTDRRRVEIAAATRSLIAERGFEGLRMRDIAERVGINIATLHYHVPSKEALVELVAQSLRDEFRAQFARHSREGLSGMEELRLEFADFREMLIGNNEAFVVMAELASRGKRDAKIGAVMQPLHAYWSRMIADVVEHGSKDGSIRSGLDAQATAAIIIGGMISSQRATSDPIAFFDSVALQLELLLTPSPHRPETLS